MSKAIFLPYSYNYRNFVLTGYVNSISETDEITVYIDNDITIDESHNNNSNITLKYWSFKRNLIQKILYKIIKHRCYIIQNTDTYRIKNKSQNLWSNIFVYPLPNSRCIFDMLMFLYRFSLVNWRAKKEFYDYDELIFTMAHKPYEHAAVVNSNMNCTKTNIIHSWDVITTKGSFIFDYTRTLVWNRTNMIEYNRFIKNVFNFKGKVDIMFPWHFRKYLREDWKPGEYVLYATSVERLVANEIGLVREIATLCEKLGFQLKIRNHPQRNKLIANTIDGLVEVEKGGYSSRDNAQFKHSFFSDIHDDIAGAFMVLSVASTIALDALCCRKEVLFLTGLGDDDRSHDFYRYNHLAALIRSCDIPVVDGLNELTPHLLSAYESKDVPNNSIDKYMNYG